MPVGATLGGAAISAGAGIYGANKASQSAGEAGDAARLAAYQQQQGIKKGLRQSEPYYQEGQNYLASHVTAGTQSAELIEDIIGLNGPEAQERARAMYETNPSNVLLQNALAEIARRTGGEFAAAGLGNSGAKATAMWERSAPMVLENFRNWQGLSESAAGRGAQTSSVAANLAQQRGQNVLAARTGQGVAGASGTIGAANADMAGQLASNNYLMNTAGRLSETDWSKLFPKKPGYQDFGGNTGGMNWGGR